MEELRQFWDAYGWMVAVGWFIGFVILMAFFRGTLKED